MTLEKYLEQEIKLMDGSTITANNGGVKPTEINDYNAEAQKLEDDLNAAESEFMWKVRGWDSGRKLMACHLDPCDPDVLERELGYFPIIAKTKKLYSRGRLSINLNIEKVFLKDTAIEAVGFLIEVATDEIHKALVGA